MKKVKDSGTYMEMMVRNDGLEMKWECQPAERIFDFVGTYRPGSVRRRDLDVHGKHHS